MTLKEIFNKVSSDTGIPVEVVEKAYKAYWSYIRNSVQDLPLKRELTETEFLSLRPNFNIPSLGKLTCTYNRYIGVKEKFNHIKNLRKKHEEAEED